MRFFSVFIFILSVVNGQNPKDPLLDKNYKGQLRWVDSIYNGMNIDEKIGQLFMPMVFTERDSSHFNDTYKIIKKYNSTAYTTTINHDIIDNQTATQIFTKRGPLAFLPISKRETSIVYSLHNNLSIKKNELVCKPDSVNDDHLSRYYVAIIL